MSSTGGYKRNRDPQCWSILEPGVSWVGVGVDFFLNIFFYQALGVQRPLKEWVFTKDHYFSRDLSSTIPRDYYFNGL